MTKILISAYACEPYRGSECEIAWQLVNRLSCENDVWVITRANNIESHTQFFSANPKPSTLNFIYLDLPPIFRIFKAGRRGFLFYYYLWQVFVAIWVFRKSDKYQFDIAHHLTGGMDWMPSGLCLFTGPFLWGPVGSEETADFLLRTLPAGQRIKALTRSVLRRLFITLDPFNRLTRFKADLTLTHTPHTFIPSGCRNIITAYQIALDSSLIPDAKELYPTRDSGVLKVLFVGELKSWKGCELALRSMTAILKTFNGNVILQIVGDGPLMKQLKEIARRAKVENFVQFKGTVDFDALPHIFAGADIFIYPSYHHGLSNVVLQAMAHALPVICLSGDGTGRFVEGDHGCAVIGDTLSEVVAELTLATRGLILNQGRRLALGERARDKVKEEMTYELMAKRTLLIYGELVSCGSKVDIDIQLLKKKINMASGEE